MRPRPGLSWPRAPRSETRDAPPMKRDQLEQLDDPSLLDEARRAGVARPEVLTREEQLDAIEALEERATGRREGSKGFLARARTLLADFLERGLNLPHTAERVRDPEAASASAPTAEGAAAATGDEDDGETGSPDVATFTLAQIYVAQGHPERALTVLAQVLRAEPGNAPARRLQARLQGLPVPADLADDADEDDDDLDDVVVTLP
ncbi:MAG: tetratricopeptide repeat protein, partial [Myxococcales bacterium]